MWDEQKQARFDALRAREETLTRREQKERAALIEELDRAEAASLQPSVEREEAVIRAWLAHDWPRIKKGAATWRRHRVLR